MASSVEQARAEELKKSVYWQHRGAHHIAPITADDQASLDQALDAAAASIHAADGLLFITGAGMGVDMGLQDFRSSNKFWVELAHPEITRYEDSSDNKWFEKDPELAWGINYAQLSSYRKADVHAGYKALLELAQMKGPDGYFCWTSNIDGVFQRAGFAPSRVHECHGNIHRLQCTKGRSCTDPENGGQITEPWEATVQLTYDPKAFRATGPLPKCRVCGALARPNVWFCTDTAYVRHSPSSAVSDTYLEWVRQFEDGKRKLVVIECGAGLVIPSCRIEAEDRATDSHGVLIRINPVDCMVPPPPPSAATAVDATAPSEQVAWYEDPRAEVGTALHRATSKTGPEVAVPTSSISIPTGSAAGLSAILERVRKLSPPLAPNKGGGGAASQRND